ncbi:MAG: adenylyltransferase/cytidyltransferase family protein [Waddliaceae bacterium]
MKQWSLEHKKKVIDPLALSDKVKTIRRSLHRIATTNGSFDLLHVGHLHILFEASKVADCLIVALNSDQSITRYKSPDRPINPLENRIQVIAALEFVDYVTWFDETDPKNILSLIKPDVHVNGSEYGHNCLEAETVESYGGSIHIVSLLPGFSTSDTIKKMTTLQQIRE